MDLELYQMFKLHFLMGILMKRSIWTNPSGGSDGQERKVCKLKGEIYGLKRASRQWYLRFHRAILADGFTMMEEAYCVYVKGSKGSFVILSLYVDDILLAGNDKEFINATNQ